MGTKKHNRFAKAYVLALRIKYRAQHVNNCLKRNDYNKAFASIASIKLLTEELNDNVYELQREQHAAKPKPKPQP